MGNRHNNSLSQGETGTREVHNSALASMVYGILMVLAGLVGSARGEEVHQRGRLTTYQGPERNTLDSEILDLELAVRVRQEFLRDRSLAPLNLGVRVDRGVATLWGPVPHPVYLARAVKRTSQVSGIYQVHSEVYLSPRMQGLGPRLPTPDQGQSHGRITSPLPDHVAGTPSSCDLRPSALPAAITPKRATSESSASPARANAKAFQVKGTSTATAAPKGDSPVRVALLKPHSLPQKPSTPEAQPVGHQTKSNRSHPTGLIQRLDELRRTESRFHRVRLIVRGSEVSLYGNGTPGRDVMALAQKIRQLDGVTRVIIKNDR